MVLGAVYAQGAADVGDAGQVGGAMVSQGTDYKLTLSWLYRPGHPWQWPRRTSTGWCLGRIGLHAKLRIHAVFTGLA